MMNRSLSRPWTRPSLDPTAALEEERHAATRAPTRGTTTPFACRLSSVEWWQVVLVLLLTGRAARAGKACRPMLVQQTKAMASPGRFRLEGLLVGPPTANRAFWRWLATGGWIADRPLGALESPGLALDTVESPPRHSDGAAVCGPTTALRRGLAPPSQVAGELPWGLGPPLKLPSLRLEDL